jgi:photosystem II stability/assembly factor-like uncharacterized protein
MIRASRLLCSALLCAGIFFLPGQSDLAQAVAPTGSPDPLRALHWRSIGPAIAGGRVAAVAGSDMNPFLYYFGAAGGGVWRTTNGGITWDDVFGKQPVASIGAVAIAPSNDNSVWVGTGESKPRNDVALGDGVYKSSDGGKTWSKAGVDSPSIARILIDRRDPNVVLVGALGDPFKDSTDRGVYRTVDGGKTWRQTLYVGPSSGAGDLAWDAHGNKLVFAGIWQIRRVPWNFASGGPDDGLYRSRDGGATWQRLRGNGLPGGTMGRIGVAVAPSNPHIVYALIQSKKGSLWRSRDGGDHWQLITRDSYINQRPFYMSRLEVDPTDPNHLYFLSEDLVESRDGGHTFHNNETAVHQDHHAMWIAANGRRLIDGNDGGAPISLDGGSIWDERYNVTIAQIYRLGYDMAVPYNVCGGMQDNDSYCGPSDSLSTLGILNHDWFDVGNDSDGSWVWPDKFDPALVWNVGVRSLNGQLTLFDRPSRQSYDVTPYVRDTNGMSIAGFPYRFNWEAPIALSRLDPHAVFYGGNVVWKTYDRGRHWKQISPDLTLNDPAHQIVAGGPINTDGSGAEFYDTILDIAPSPLDSDTIWVGTDDGLVQVTRDGGAHWKNVTMTGIKPYGRVETVEASPHAAAAAFAVVDRRISGDQTPYIFATSDYGATWKSVSGDLPTAEIIHVVRQDPRNPDLLYAGSEHGVWVSFDGGSHWRSLNVNLPTVSVHDMRVHPRDNDLIIATHGRGFWILDDLAPLQGLAAASSSSGTTFFAPKPAYTYFRWWSHEYGSGAGECCAPQDQFAGENPPAGVILNYYLPAAQKAAPSISVADISGKVLAQVAGTNASGINRISWDLSETPPVPWTSALPWNQGGLLSSFQVIPGTYTLTLHAGAQSQTQTLTVKPDPRAHWTQAEYVERRAFLNGLYSELSQIDVALNNLDAIRARLDHKIQALKTARAPAQQLAPLEAQLRQAQAISAEFSSNPRNSEDDQWKPDKLRERVQVLIDVYGLLSQGPPLPAHRREAAEIQPIFDAAMSHYRSFVRLQEGGQSS